MENHFILLDLKEFSIPLEKKDPNYKDTLKILTNAS